VIGVTVKLDAGQAASCAVSPCFATTTLSTETDDERFSGVLREFRLSGRPA
jgi:hypothetical protein